MGVSEKHALDDACKIEHDISDETFAALKKEYDRLKKEETQNKDWTIKRTIAK